MMQKRFHIIIDAWDVDEKLLNNPILIENISRRLVEICRMKILHGPVVIKGVPENPGITCFTIIDFSHISIHTFTKSKEICIDIFSCKKYDFKEAKEYICDLFNLDSKKMIYKEINYDQS